MHLPFLRPALDEQQAVLRVLFAQSAGQARTPNYSSERPLMWQIKRWRGPSSDPKMLYKLLYEDLLLAQKLNGAGDIEQRRIGLRVAMQAAFCAAQKVGDDRLRVRIFEAWLLPSLAVAPLETWKDGSCRMILERACAAYAATKQADRQLAVLTYLVHLDDGASANSRDWARVKRAELLSANGEYLLAVQQLEEVQSRAMQGSRQWIEDLKARAAQADAAVPKAANNAEDKMRDQSKVVPTGEKGQ